MKNKNYILVFTLIIAFLLVMVSYVQASNGNNGNPLIIINNTGNNEAGNDQTGNNNVAQNNQQSSPNNVQTNNQQGNLLSNNITRNNTVGNNATNGTANNTLPKTGVAEDSTLIVFIAICIASAIYAFVKIRNYK